MKQQYKLFTIVVITILLIGALTFTGRKPAQAQQTLTLQAPSFVQPAAYESPTTDIGAYLTEEAGISAYVQTANPISLSQVRGEFQIIEAETTDYIIGSVTVPYHPDHFDVHVYVHKDGWILAYYLKADPTSKIVDVNSRTISTTKLDTVIAIVAGAAGEAVSNLNYYDFRYPNATNILFVAEDYSDGDDFTISIPDTYGYFERSWAVYGNNYACYIKVDGNSLSPIYYVSPFGYGILTASQLLPNVSHLINVRDFGVLVITYRAQ